MELMRVNCSTCNGQLNDMLLNFWAQIGRDRISPVIQPKCPWNIGPANIMRQGEKGTILESCRVQEVLCKWCRSILGSECISSPVNHLLHKGQLLLRTSSIQVKDFHGHVTYVPVITRKLNFRTRLDNNLQPRDYYRYGYKNYRQLMGESPEISHVLENIDAQREDIKRLDVVGGQVETSLSLAMHHIKNELRKLEMEMTQMTDRSSETSTRNGSLKKDAPSAKAEIGKTKRAIRPLVAQRQLEQKSSSMRNTIGKVGTSLRIESSNNWRKHQQRLNLLKSELESIRFGSKELQVLLERAHTTAKTALAASDWGTEKMGALEAEMLHLGNKLEAKRSYKPSSTT
ncbi:hypothetical protein F5Y14DRAFT_433524 [Nemania sp. NC0429]|nr:hypothetical protein F5Y14DRAFT_433524 [Nemania sp. NC0429]